MIFVASHETWTSTAAVVVPSSVQVPVYEHSMTAPLRRIHNSGFFCVQCVSAPEISRNKWQDGTALDGLYVYDRYLKCHTNS